MENIELLEKSMPVAPRLTAAGILRMRWIKSW